MKKDNGFTLLELILGISIIAILVYISPLNLDYLYNYKREEQLKEFIRDIKYARNRSMVEGIPHSIVLDPARNTYIIYRRETQIKKSIKRKQFKHGLKLMYTNWGSTEIRFNITGIPDQAGTISFLDGSRESILISISPVTGRVNYKREKWK